MRVRAHELVVRRRHQPGDVVVGIARQHLRLVGRRLGRLTRRGAAERAPATRDQRVDRVRRRCETVRREDLVDTITGRREPTHHSHEVEAGTRDQEVARLASRAGERKLSQGHIRELQPVDLRIVTDVVDGVDAVVRREGIQVAAIAADQHVAVAGAAVERIGARTAAQGIGAGAPDERVAAVLAVKRVAAVAAIDRVVTGAAVGNVVARLPVQDVVAVAAVLNVVAAVAVQRVIAPEAQLVVQSIPTGVRVSRSCTRPRRQSRAYVERERRRSRLPRRVCCNDLDRVVEVGAIRRLTTQSPRRCREGQPRR